MDMECFVQEYDSRIEGIIARFLADGCKEGNKLPRRKQQGIRYHSVLDEPAPTCYGGIQSGPSDSGFRRNDELAASGGEYNPKRFKEKGIGNILLTP